MNRVLYYCCSIALLMAATSAYAQRPSDDCHECSLPGARNQRDTLMDVNFRDQTILRNIISARRIIANVFGEDRQSLRLKLWRNGRCVDTTVAIDQVTAFSIGNLGIGGQPLVVPVYPSREFYRNATIGDLPTSFLEITALAGYGGSDKSKREIGFSSTYFGAEALVAPFGSFLGDKVSLALGGGLSFEGGRMRIPVQGHLRWTFMGAAHLESAQNFVPNACQFRLPGDPVLTPPQGNFTETPSPGERDSTVYYIREKVVVADRFRPFLFIEGGPVFDGKFDGAGRNPSLNPDEYGEYFAGGGIGTPLFDWGTISLAYRYMRLNLRTPCPACEEKFVVNTNRVQSVLLKLGLHFPF
jgi:hypothetical protein